MRLPLWAFALALLLVFPAVGAGGDSESDSKSEAKAAKQAAKAAKEADKAAPRDGASDPKRDRSDDSGSEGAADDDSDEDEHAEDGERPEKGERRDKDGRKDAPSKGEYTEAAPSAPAVPPRASSGRPVLLRDTPEALAVDAILTAPLSPYTEGPPLPAWIAPTAVLRVEGGLLDASGSFSEVGTIVSYRFIGPGLPGIWQPDPVLRTDLPPGMHVVRLQVLDDAGRIHTTATTILVSPDHDQTVPGPGALAVLAILLILRRR